MNDFIKWVLRHIFVGVVWVFLLSIWVGGDTIFSLAHGVFVENSLVAAADRALEDFWGDVSKTAKLTYRHVTTDSQPN